MTEVFRGIGDTGEGVRTRYDSITTTNSAKMSRGSALQHNVQLLISVQGPEGRTIELDINDTTIEEARRCARHRTRVREFLSATRC